MPLIVANVSRAIIGFVNTQNSVTWSVGFGVNVASGYDETDADAYAEQVLDNFTGAISPRLNENVQTISCSFTDLGSITGSEGHAVGSTVGTVTGNIATVDQCLVTTLLTGARGRSNRGRMFMRGLSVSDYDDDYGTRQWKPDTVSTWQGALEGWLAEMLGNPTPVSVISRLHSSFRQVTSADARYGIFSQRRTGRQPG